MEKGMAGWGRQKEKAGRTGTGDRGVAPTVPGVAPAGCPGPVPDSLGGRAHHITARDDAGPSLSCRAARPGRATATAHPSQRYHCSGAPCTAGRRRRLLGRVASWQSSSGATPHGLTPRWRSTWKPLKTPSVSCEPMHPHAHGRA